MTYQEAIDWLFLQLPMYQNLGKRAYKSDLSNSIKLAKHLDNPHKKFKSIHVAGTNGKGSTSHMLASIFQEAGYKVGLYTSPHLKDFRERIRLNGRMIEEAYVLNFVKNNHDFFKENQLSFFEMTVGLAFEYFANNEVDIAIIEVGLGGRLDSTNIITPELSIITNIGLDHTQILGETRAKIAFEKAGIIKENIPCVVGTSILETKQVFEQIAASKNAELHFAEDMDMCPYKTDLQGDYQTENSRTVFNAIKVFRDNKAWVIDDKAIKQGFLSVMRNTQLQGRWQILSKSPLIVCDTAHNYEGLNWVVKQIENQPKENLHIIFGVVKDKKLKQILPLLPKQAVYYFTKPENSRALSEIELQSVALDYDLKGNSYTSVIESFDAAKEALKPDDMLFIGGSTFVVAEII